MLVRTIAVAFVSAVTVGIAEAEARERYRAPARSHYTAPGGQGYKAGWDLRDLARPSPRKAGAALYTQYQGAKNYFRYGDHRGPRYQAPSTPRYNGGHMRLLRRY